MTEPEAFSSPQPVDERSESYPFWDYGDLAVFIVGLIAAFLASAIAVGAAFGALGVGRSLRTPAVLVAQFLAYGLAFALLAVFLRLKYRKPFFSSLGWISPWERFAPRVAAGVLLALGVALAGALLKTPDIDMPIKELLKDRLSLVLVGVSAVTIGPVCEELAFRGFLYPLLARSAGPAVAILGSALPFALLHGQQYAWSWRHVLLITVAGAGFGWMRYRSGSTAASAVMHAAYNGTLFTAYLVQGKDLPAQW